MDNRQLELIYQQAKAQLLERHNDYYEPQYQHIVCILNAFIAVHTKEYPGQAVNFIEQFRQIPKSVDED